MSPLLNRQSPRFVIPGLTRNPGFPVKTGTPFLMVPCLRRDGAWIPAGVYPVLCYGAGMTLCLANNGLISKFIVHGS
jgi:hypothetical protein